MTGVLGVMTRQENFCLLLPQQMISGVTPPLINELHLLTKFKSFSRIIRSKSPPFSGELEDSKSIQNSQRLASSYCMLGGEVDEPLMTTSALENPRTSISKLLHHMLMLCAVPCPSKHYLHRKNFRGNYLCAIA